MLIVRIFLLPVNSVPAHNQSKIIFLCLRPLLPFGVPFAFTYKSSCSKCRLKTCLCLQSSRATGYPRDKIKMQMWCFLIQMNISTNHIKLWIAKLELFHIILQHPCYNLCRRTTYSGIIPIAYLNDNLIK